MKTFLSCIILCGIVMIFISCQKEISDITLKYEVSDVDIIYYADSLKLKWKDPLDSGFNKIEIEVENDVFFVNKNIQAKTFTEINQDKEYKFLIKTVDNYGNRSEGINILGKYDYRNFFLGSFKFLSFSAINHLATIYYYDSIFYLGTVFYNNNLDSIINIEYQSGAQTKCDSLGEVNLGGYILPKVEVSGVLAYPEIQNCDENISFQGKFHNDDSVTFWVHHDAYKISVAQIVEGVRIKIKTK